MPKIPERESTESIYNWLEITEEPDKKQLQSKSTKKIEQLTNQALSTARWTHLTFWLLYHQKYQ